MSTKVLLGFFLFCLDLELFPKIKKKKRSGFYGFTETTFINNSRFKQNKKNHQNAFVCIVK